MAKWQQTSIRRNPSSKQANLNPPFFYRGENVEIYVIAHVFQGILSDVRAFAKEEDANKYEEELCKQNGIPYIAIERDKYYEENEVDDDINKWTIELQ